MNRLLLGLMIALWVLTSGSAAALGPMRRPFGVGLCLGEPAGVTGKFWWSERHAVDMAVGYGFFPYAGIAFYADYLYHAQPLIRAGKVPFDLLFYLGVGGKLGVWQYERRGEDKSGFGLGVRAPFGVTMVFSRVPFDAYLEIAPSFAFGVPEPIWFDLDASIGGRFYF